eukprot:TRINITY_DN9739_c0_g1_i1.p2 TRINITY_DN9739_c0_g1~~TRINITY_DN9739_c0_g1_i1.p2  ORF type:complete len:250 (-),score=27.13 TRINITY_DN9739_c0_g1_i1:134-883(-)
MSNERKVNFTMPLKLPDTLKSIIGLEVISVMECQSYERQADGTIIVKSIPKPQIASASNFESTIRFTISKAEDDNEKCVMKGKVQCECKGYWGLQSTIESQMLSAAEENLDLFLEFCKSYCNSKLLPMDGMEFSDEEFYEADEIGSQSSQSSILNGGQLNSARENSKSKRDLTQVQRQDLGAAGATNEHLRNINETLKQISQQITTVVQESGKSRRGSATLQFLFPFLAGMSCGVALTALYFRRRASQS